MAIRVTVWNEYLHEVQEERIAQVYPDGIHGCIANFLNEAGFDAKTATLSMPEHGLTEEVLDNTDVLIWWGHMGHHLVDDAIVERVYDRVMNGMGLICLHSAHASKIFHKVCGTPTLQLRCDEAYNAWRKGIARRIIVCGGQMNGEPRPHSEAMRDYLREKGVPADSILVENRSQNTVQNLQNARLIMEHRGFRRAALVTSDYHMTRALWIAHAEGMLVCGIPAPTPCNLRAHLRTRKRETVSWFLYFIHGVNKNHEK